MTQPLINDTPQGRNVASHLSRTFQFGQSSKYCRSGAAKDNCILHATFVVLLHKLVAHGFRSKDDPSRLAATLAFDFGFFSRIFIMHVSHAVTPARLWEHWKRTRTDLREFSSSGDLDHGLDSIFRRKLGRGTRLP